jgi:hypothetical protein
MEEEIIHPRLSPDLEVGDKFYAYDENENVIVKVVVEKNTQDGYTYFVTKAV